MSKRKNKKNEILIDKDYIKNCLLLTPEERLEKLREINSFLFSAMPEESKQNWTKLKKANF